MYKSHFQSNDCQEKAIYKKFSNKFTKLKALSKQKYYETSLKESVGQRQKLKKLGSCFAHYNPESIILRKACLIVLIYKVI